MIAQKNSKDETKQYKMSQKLWLISIKVSWLLRCRIRILELTWLSQYLYGKENNDKYMKFELMQEYSCPYHVYSITIWLYYWRSLLEMSHCWCFNLTCVWTKSQNIWNTLQRQSSIEQQLVIKIQKIQNRTLLVHWLYCIGLTVGQAVQYYPCLLLGVVLQHLSYCQG